MRVRSALAVTAATAALLAGGGLSATTALTAAPDPVVKVTRDNGGVQVRTGVPGQPLLSVSVDNDGVCTGFSYQTGTCVPVGPIS